MKWPWFSYGRLVADLKQAEDYKSRLKIQKDPTYPPRINFEPFFNGREIDFNSIQESLKWIAELQSYPLDPKSVNQILSKTNSRKELGDLLKKFKSSKVSILDGFSFLTKNFSDPSKVIGSSNNSLNSESLATIAHFINQLRRELPLFQQWIDYQAVIKQLNDLGGEAFLIKLKTSEISPELWYAVFERQFYAVWLDHVHGESPALREFNIKLHQKTIQQFTKLDPERQEFAKQEIVFSHADRWKQWSESSKANQSKDLLDAESRKQKKHKEVRQFIQEAPELVSTLKPCWLMSPLAVSEYIDPEVICFDTVIFDEASQILTQDAVPVIMRAKQVIVVGDDQQLPPTSFFSGTTAEDEEDEEDDSAAYESLLAECGKFMKKFTLMWHYRSRDESLITFSNREFYRSELISFPSPVKDISQGVYFRYVENGIYDRGGKRINLREVEEVGKLALNHVQSRSDQSLGIIALSREQAEAIENQIEQLSHQNSALADFCQEDSNKFFVKPLENVQGDERDVIILSFCYGKDDQGKLVHKFGPLNHNMKGPRRLNVAVTRAKHKLIFVASIRSTDLDPQGKEPLIKLQRYFEYAEKNSRESNSYPTNADPSSDLSLINDIYHALQDRGYTICKSVGRSEYPIDLVVVNDQKPDEFLLGIECDGEIYSRYSTARDRDRLRAHVLKELGWELYRIWSPEWFKDRSGQIEQLVERIEQLRTQK